MYRLKVFVHLHPVKMDKISRFVKIPVYNVFSGTPHTRQPRAFPWQIFPAIDRNISPFSGAAAGPLNWPIFF
jgi:hypothetical protein